MSMRKQSARSTRSTIAAILDGSEEGLVTARIQQQLIARNWHTEKNILVTIISQMAPNRYSFTGDYLPGKRGNKRIIPTHEIGNYRDYMQAIRMWFSGEHVDDVLMVVKG